MICANRCSCGASSWCHFACLAASLMNRVEYLSVSNCSYSTSGSFSLYLYIGYEIIDSTNSSMNNANGVSGVFIDAPSSFTSSYCTFSNNKAADSTCIYFYSTSGIISMSFANIVHNNSPLQYGVVFLYGGTSRMLYCIFHNNSNYLFYVNAGSLEVSHSHLDHSLLSFSTKTAVSTAINNSFSFRMTHQLQFFSSFHCNADIPIIEQQQLYTINQSNMKPYSFLYLMIILMIS